jgi:hypothetical protein
MPSIITDITSGANIEKAWQDYSANLAAANEELEQLENKIDLYVNEILHTNWNIDPEQNEKLINWINKHQKLRTPKQFRAITTSDFSRFIIFNLLNLNAPYSVSFKGNDEIIELLGINKTTSNWLEAQFKMPLIEYFLQYLAKDSLSHYHSKPYFSVTKKVDGSIQLTRALQHSAQ